jgi:hypothetical protein
MTEVTEKINTKISNFGREVQQMYMRKIVLIFSDISKLCI